MLLSLSWLREFVPYTGSAEELGETLTMLGLELEEIQRPFAALEPLVVGFVQEAVKHPESDHLSICKVDVGEKAGGVLQIVCGAPNVAAGQWVPVALVGASIAGMQIKKAKLRGVESCGMICSERELGLTEDHSGILVLPEVNHKGEKLFAGQRLLDALRVDEEVLEISITPNRADCLSVLGLAREVALAYNLPITMPNAKVEESGEDVSGTVPITVENTETCLDYTGRLFAGAKVAPAPAWMRYRLHAVGVRPISNIVDVTNYVLMELGQPLHAFDSSLLQGSAIRVRLAKEGEKCVTLDGQERTLVATDQVICDGNNTAVALAGVMGGLATEIHAESTAVFLECALFQPACVRRTSRRLGLSSESSYRYERGVDPEGLAFALERAAHLIAAFSGAKVLKGVCRGAAKKWQAPKVQFARSRAEALLGIEVEEAFCVKTLEGLGCKIEKKGADDWLIATPSWRYDLDREADIIEELARVKGVDKIPATLPAIRQSLADFGKPENMFHFLSRVKHCMVGLGLQEVINYSFVGHKDLDLLGLPKEGRVGILNPLTAEQDVLRTALTAGILYTLRQNIAQGADALHVFEVAHIFAEDKTSTTTVRESRRLAVALYGSRFQHVGKADFKDASWPDMLDTQLFDYPDMRGVVEYLFQHFLYSKAPKFEKMAEHPFLSPAVQVLGQNGENYGFVGRVKPAVASEFYARHDVWVAELDLDAMYQLASVKVKALPLPVYPPVRRDVTFSAPLTMPVENVENALRDAAPALLQNVVLQDIYVPEGVIGAQTRNLTFRLTFRHADRTLQDAEVDKAREKMVSAVVQALGVKV